LRPESEYRKSVKSETICNCCLLYAEKSGSKQARKLKSVSKFTRWTSNKATQFPSRFLIGNKTEDEERSASGSTAGFTWHLRPESKGHSRGEGRPELGSARLESGARIAREEVTDRAGGDRSAGGAGSHGSRGGEGGASGGDGRGGGAPPERGRDGLPR
jgi:hypothetical protein